MQSQPIFCAANHTGNPSCWPPRGAQFFLFLFVRGVGDDFYEGATWDMWKKKKKDGHLALVVVEDGDLLSGE